MALFGFPLTGIHGFTRTALALVAADGVDARGEREAARVAAQPFGEDTCDYTPQVYDATPGWLFR